MKQPYAPRFGCHAHFWPLPMRAMAVALVFVLWAGTTRAEAPATLADVQRVVGAPRSQPLSGPSLDARTEEVAALLRCPVCQGLSVADSPSSMAVKMKNQVRELLAAGFDRDQILAYFERSYGEFVRLEPPLRGVNWLVWLAPLLGLIAGAVVVTWALRSTVARDAQPGWPKTAGARPLSAPPETQDVARAEAGIPGPDDLPDDARLAPYVLRVRELAYGWPGGIAPSSVAPVVSTTSASVSGPDATPAPRDRA